MSTSPTHSLYLGSTSKSNTSRNLLSTLGSAILLAVFTAYVLVLSGCGASGYAGGGIVSLSASSVTIDAGQSFSVSSNLFGNPAVSWSLPGTSCSPSGCGTLSSNTGDSIVYTAPAGLTSQIKTTLTANVAGTTNHSTVSITVNPDPTIAGIPPAGTVGTPYTTTLVASGGTAPLKLSVLSGTLPAGLSFNAATGVISGTPTMVGTSNFTVQLVDSSDVPYTVTAPETIVIASSSTTPLTIAGNPPAGTVGVLYSTTLTASGGTSPYTWSVIFGTLPAGLTLSATTGVISGTPTTQGTFVFTAQAQDASGTKASAAFSITINAAPTPLTLTLTSLPNGTVGIPYNQTIGVSGGTPPYSCTITTGTLPAGLALTSAGCVVSGTPSAAGTVNLIVHATDSGNPMETTSGPVSLTINPAPLTLTLTSLPNGTVGVQYSATIGVSGGTAPYSCTITSGTLPAGLALTSAGCLVSGTPTVAGTVNLTVHATDSSNPMESTSGPVSLTINPAPLSLALSTLPNATVGVPYSQVIGVNGGTAPYSCTIVSGTLPAGLALTSAGCLVSGTPTVAGTVNLIVKATDSSNPMESTTGPVSLTVLPNGTTLTITSPPNGTVGSPYTGTIGVTGGTGPYSCTIATGTLPAGLTLTSSGCAISGTPTASGTSNLTVTATDTSSPVKTTTGPVSLTIAPVSSTLTLTSPPNATVGTPYTGTIGVTGGTGPYSCTIATGTLPAGLTLTSAGCVITGTPTTAGTSNLTVTATDSSGPPKTGTGPVTLTVQPISPLTLAGSLPNGVVGVPYTQTLHAAGGIAPYTYALTAGALPAGLNLSASGVISGTPTTVGASSFTVTATDTEPTPQTANLPLVLLITYPTTANDSEFTGPYAYLFQGYDDNLLGILAYQTATVGSFTADGAGVLNNGELDSNHQGSNPSGMTISSSQFIGTYTIGTDNRGLLTITTLNPDGTTAQTYTYAIALGAPVSPSTISTHATLIEFDNNQLQGTRGSGTVLAQQPTAFAAGLTGSYAFGLQGDTPCLPTCTVGIIAGPAAAVGEFTANGSGSISSGTSDANVATAKLASAALTGSYGTTDGNGRLQLTMNTAGTPAGVYPEDYAVYVVSANEVFILSTDKHSSYILLAGSAQLHTQSSFSNASLSGPFVGYENAQSNPGLLGSTLQNVLNYSVATIFRAGTTNVAGTCDITNVDTGGATALVNQITGAGGILPTNVVQALLGTYQSTGTSTCTVAANGRAVLNYPPPSGLLALILGPLGLDNPPDPRVVYLFSPNDGYFLETGYAGLGNIEPQTGAPFSLATFDGTYTYGTAPASSLISINSSGIIIANGAGQATSTLDENVGVGTLNVLQLGVTNTSSYALTDATAGRFTFGTDVIYAINPGRFVLVDTNPLTTSPSIALVY